MVTLRVSGLSRMSTSAGDGSMEANSVEIDGACDWQASRSGVVGDEGGDTDREREEGSTVVVAWKGAVCKEGGNRSGGNLDGGKVEAGTKEPGEAGRVLGWWSDTVSRIC